MHGKPLVSAIPRPRRPAWTPTGAAVLALRTGRPLVPGFARRGGDGTFRLTFEPPIAPEDGIDQDIPSIPGVFVPFFNRFAWTPSGAATLALRARCPIMPGFIHRKPDGTHKVKILPPIEVPSEGSLKEKVVEMTAAATAAIEWQVRAWPEQWVWMHRRWRRQPGPDARIWR